MNGAESLVRTLLTNSVDVCFTNPGTSEMHFVAALDRVEGMRCVLGLFEDVVTGAADGYYRMSGKPACTLLHLGPGLGNGLANRAYQILRGELRSKGAGTPGQRATDMLTLDRPALDWVALARGHGVEDERAATLEELARGLGREFSRRGPFLVELVL